LYKNVSVDRFNNLQRLKLIMAALRSIENIIRHYLDQITDLEQQIEALKDDKLALQNKCIELNRTMEDLVKEAANTV